MVGILDEKFCVSAQSWKGSYGAYKVYLGRNRVLPSDTLVSIDIEFRSREEEAEFFDFWQNEVQNGAKPFYVKTGLYGEMKHYLVSLVGSLEHSKRKLGVSGKFELYRTRTLDENIPPSIKDQTFSVDMDSSSNYMHIKAEDYDTLTYSVSTPPSHGSVEMLEDGVAYYTPNDGFSGVDSFIVRVLDEIGATAEATISVDVINWQLQEQFKLVVESDGHLIIDYVDPAALDPLVVQAVDEISTGLINANGEYEIDTTQTQHIDTIIVTADGEWLVTPK